MEKTKLGRYDIARRVGEAPWGPIYEATDSMLQRRVVLHTVSLQDLGPQAADEFIGRLHNDAQQAARLAHPGIVPVMDCGSDSELAYLVTQSAPGEDLKRRLERGEKFSPASAVAIVFDLLGALDHAHSHDIVHRAVRPSNILVDQGRARLAGFGLSSIQQAEVTTAARLGALAVGTRYMSPEQVQGQRLDARADLFSAGVVLYELLTGVQPFKGNNPFAIIQQIVTIQPPPPSQLDASLPQELDAVLAKALAKNRGERFASGREFAQALKAAVAPTPGQPAAAAPASAARSEAEVDVAMELEYWKDIKDSDDAEDFQQFLHSFPAGTLAALAQRRLRKLGRQPQGAVGA